MIKVLVFAEKEFSEAIEFDAYEEARSYGRGVEKGASLYGCGLCGAYVLPNDEQEMRKLEEPDEIERALAAPTRRRSP